MYENLRKNLLEVDRLMFKTQYSLQHSMARCKRSTGDKRQERGHLLAVAETKHAQ